jgi:hypothetical protein
VTDRERDAALKRIADRHLKSEDIRWPEANSDSDTAAYDVLAYLRRRHRQLPKLAAGDVWDELVLSAWVYWDQRRRERELLNRGLHLGLSLSEVGRYLGIGTRQGTRDYLDRLDALLGEYTTQSALPRRAATGDGTTDPLARYGRATRKQRGADVHSTRATRVSRRAKPSQTDWITLHQARIRSVLRGLLIQAARVGLHPSDASDKSDNVNLHGDVTTPGGALPDAQVDDDPLADYLTWLTEDFDSDQINPGTIGTLGLVLGQLRTNATATELPRNHGLRLAMGAADRLRSDYANLVTDDG